MMQVVQRLIDHIRTLAVRLPGASVGVSIGLAHFGQPPDKPDDLLGHADQAMYRAKAAGKGCIMTWSQEHDGVNFFARNQHSGG
jgi:GGDEF domain-containing protein